MLFYLVHYLNIWNKHVVKDVHCLNIWNKHVVEEVFTYYLNNSEGST